MHPGWILLIPSFIKRNYFSLYCGLTADLLIQQKQMGTRLENWKIIKYSSGSGLVRFYMLFFCFCFCDNQIHIIINYS